MAELRTKQTVLNDIEKAKLKQERKYEQLEMVNKQFKLARNVFICLICLLLSVATMESKNIHGLTPVATMLITIVTMIMLIVGWFGSVVFGTMLKNSMGGSPTSTFLICFLTFGIYAGWTALYFFQNPQKKEILQEIEDVKVKIEELENELQTYEK